MVQNMDMVLVILFTLIYQSSKKENISSKLYWCMKSFPAILISLVRICDF